MNGLDRFSFNQATANDWPLADLVAGCAEAGVSTVGLWRAPVTGYGLARAAKLVRDAGLSVSSLCRGGFFCDDGWLDDNRRAIDEAATLGAPVLVLVPGGLGPRNLERARAHVADAIGALLPHATDAGVRLAIEPMHPMYCSDRGVVSTLASALDLAAPFPAATVGVVVDTYHLWWDERVWDTIAEAGSAGRIACFQVADWITPLPEGVLTGRALPGAGCIEIARFATALDLAGYSGPIEVEVFNSTLWRNPGAAILADTIAAYRRHVVGTG